MLVKTLKNIFALIFFYTQDIKNIIFNPKFYQHFLPSLFIIMCKSGLIASLPLCKLRDVAPQKQEIS